MRVASLWFKLLSFRSDKSGTIALVFALAAVPAIAMVGAAIDYGRALNAKTKVQLALDASALFAASSQFKTNAEREQAARDAFDANMADSGYAGQTSIDVSIKNGRIVASADLDVSTTLGGLLGQHSIGVSGLSEVPLPGGGKAEVVLVLDYSDSMLTNDKYVTMRLAAEELIRIVSSDFTNKDVKIALGAVCRHGLRQTEQEVRGAVCARSRL